MIYPENFESKIGFTTIRKILKEFCLSGLGQSLAQEISFSNKASEVNEWQSQVREFRRLLMEREDWPMSDFFDVREAVTRARMQGVHLEEEELFHIGRSLITIQCMVDILTREEDTAENEKDGDKGMEAWGKNHTYPALYRLADGVATFPKIINRIQQVIDKFGHIRDNATPELLRIRRELARMEGSVSRTLYSILRTAQSEGVVDKDVAPTLRDGRLVIPVLPGLKRKISGIIHDESATGKTVFVEPTEVVEANNKIRELESEERHEVIRILTEVTNQIRPVVREMLDSYHFLATIDLIGAKAKLADKFQAFEPKVSPTPVIDWIRARHPLLEQRLATSTDHSSYESTKIIPLEITLTTEKHILLISGPNAGGKSVCLKTVGLLQYMLQCGLPIPIDSNSKCGCFDDIMIDIGDEQSLENDLSTYSSHLLNMKNMMKQANHRTLILIDEFGTGTEPQIGGAIAESVLGQFCKKGAWGVITTHYQNLKHFAEDHLGVVNGAMLYDRHEMRPLFQLAIGRPGSSFAIEIARKIGLPEEVIAEASEIVGSDYIQSDKYLQDIVRDKRYWENKRQNIHQREKKLEQTMTKYATGLEEVEKERKEILRKAKEEAQQILKESNKRIENAIREIREKDAEKEETKRIRQQLKEFENEINEIDAKAKDDAISKKIEQIKNRKERHEQNKKNKAEREQKAAEKLRNAVNKKAESDKNKPLQKGDKVKMRGASAIGIIEDIDSKMAMVIFGEMRTKVKIDRLIAISDTETIAADSKPQTKAEQMADRITNYGISKETRKTIDSRKKNFHQDLDVRGLRGDEALNAVQYFIDDAILMGMQRVRILHGKGNGILRQLIRQYLSTVPNVVGYQDEHVQFGGAGITVVDF